MAEAYRDFSLWLCILNSTSIIGHFNSWPPHATLPKKSLLETIQLHPHSRPFAHALIGTRSRATSRRCQQPRCSSGSQRTAHKRSATNKITAHPFNEAPVRCAAPCLPAALVRALPAVAAPSRNPHPKSRMGAGLPSCARHLHAACERWPGTPITSVRSGSAPGVSLRKHQRRLGSRGRFCRRNDEIFN
jgi:hypothetical protein